MMPISNHKGFHAFSYPHFHYTTAKAAMASGNTGNPALEMLL
jgi:hypothetical protein